MLKPRLIPVLLYKNGILVRSRTFSFHQSTGDPIEQVNRFTDWKADELIYLDINRDDTYDYRDTMSVIGSTSSRKDPLSAMSHDFVEVVEEVAKRCMIPLTVGGKIRTLEDIRIRLKKGADKVSINTQALETPLFIETAAKTFGNQCVVVSVDVRYDAGRGTHEVFSKFGKEGTQRDPVDWCKEVEQRGAGEILLQSIDRDGTGEGYDLDLVRKVAEAVEIPVICLGGVGTFPHLVQGLFEGRASAVAAANIFHFTEHSIIHAKKYMQSAGIDVRL